MKKIAFLILALVGGTGIFAQTTYNLDWYVGINSSDASIEIDEGDTVIWTFTDAGPHSVTSDAGSPETFDSGILSTGVGTTFSHTFTQTGISGYHCEEHPSTMVGLIKVNALSAEEKSLRQFSVYPNPASSQVFIELPNQHEGFRVRMFDMSGKMIYNQSLEMPQTSIDISSWANGVYIVEVANDEISNTKRFVKK